MNNQRFPSVWDAIENTLEEAESLKLRSALMIELRNHITRKKMNRAHAAKLIRGPQSRVSDFMSGKLNLFSLGELVDMATAAGLHIEIKEAGSTSHSCRLPTN